MPMADRAAPIKVGIVGARGYVGAEMIALFAAHPAYELTCVSSRERDGQRVADHNPGYCGDLRYSAPSPAQLPSLRADAVLSVVAVARRLGRHLVAVTASPLPGPSGNVEYFVLLRQAGPGAAIGEDANDAAVDGDRGEVERAVAEGPTGHTDHPPVRHGDEPGAADGARA